MTRLRVAVIGPTADRTDVGESHSTWHWTSGLGEVCDVTLLTYVKSGRLSAASTLPHVRVVEWSDLPIPASLERINAMVHPGYVKFFMKARRWLKRAIRDGERFDLIHQIAPLAPRYPSPAVGLGIPYIVGPLAGGLPTPPAFRPEMKGQPFYMHLRELDPLRLRYDCLLRRTLSEASLVIGVAPYVRDLLHSIPLVDFDCESEIGISSLPAPTPRDFSVRPFRLLYVGRIVRTKGLRDAVRALGQCRELDWTLDVFGAGNDLDACRREAASLALGDRVRFHGRVARADLDRWYRESHLFLFPSFREPSGNVIIEAMAWGLPIVTCDRGGPGFVAPTDAAFHVTPDSPESLKRQLGQAIRRAMAEPETCAKMSATARATIQGSFLWTSKIDRMCDRYRRVLNQAQRQPTETRDP